MKKTNVWLMLMALSFFSSTIISSAIDYYHLVKVYKMDKSFEYKVCNAEEFKALQERVRAEGMYFSQALREAEKEWKEEAKQDDTKPSFPGGKMSAPKLKVVKAYTDPVDADEKLAKYEDAEFKKMEREMEKVGKLRGKARERYDEKQAKEEEKQAILDEAIELTRSKLNPHVAKKLNIPESDLPGGEKAADEPKPEPEKKKK